MQKDSWDIDYQATLNLLNAARKHQAAHFVLLSAICVQKPLLEFQHAKLKFEAALQAAGDITYSIVRPTAFFKSLAGQVRKAGLICKNHLQLGSTGPLQGMEAASNRICLGQGLPFSHVLHCSQCLVHVVRAALSFLPCIAC